MLSKQEIFDKVAVHLLTQKKKASTGVSCKYRLLKDDLLLMCGIGCLIPNNLYQKEMDTLGLGARNIVENYPRLKPYIGDDKRFLVDIQTIHDNRHARSWKTELRSLAEQHRLDPKILDTFE